MLIACPNCATSYEVEPSSLGRAGRTVRCVRCRHVWFATAPAVVAAAVAEPVAAEPAAAAPAVGSGAPPLEVATAAPESPPEPTVAAEPDPEPVIAATDPSPAGAEAEAPAPAQPEFLLDDRGPAPLKPPTVADAPALAPSEPGEPPPTAAERAATTIREDVETAAARRIRRRVTRRTWRRPRLGWSTVILALLALLSGLVAWRAEVVRWLPQTASLYAAIGLPVNLRGLVFADVATETESQDGVPVLVVEGTIMSVVRRPAEVPRLRFALRNERGNEIHTWTALAPKSLLAPGATVTFRSRLASPPREGREVVVRFFHRRDATTGNP